MVGNYGLTGFSRYENFGILTSNHESNFGNFFGILGQKWPKVWNFGGKSSIFMFLGLQKVFKLLYVSENHHILYISIHGWKAMILSFSRYEKKKTGAP